MWWAIDGFYKNVIEFFMTLFSGRRWHKIDESNFLAHFAMARETHKNHTIYFITRTHIHVCRYPSLWTRSNTSSQEVIYDDIDSTFTGAHCCHNQPVAIAQQPTIKEFGKLIFIGETNHILSIHPSSSQLEEILIIKKGLLMKFCEACAMEIEIPAYLHDCRLDLTCNKVTLS